MNNYPNAKKVNIIPTVAITRLNPPIRTTVRRVTKSVSEIRTCLMNRAIVEEILPDNSTLRLDLTNYDKNNRPSEKDKVIAKIEEIQQSKVEEQPVVVEESQPVVEEPVKEEEVVKTEDIEVVPVTVEEQPVTEEVKTEEAAEHQQVQPQQQIIYNKKHKKH